jgi:hypothetical protein
MSIVASAARAVSPVVLDVEVGRDPGGVGSTDATGSVSS